MLRIARDVAWLRLGSCTDHVISAAAATPEKAIKPSPTSSRTRRASASRIDAGKWLTRGMTRSIAGMLMSLAGLFQNFDKPVQRLGRRFTVGDQREADVTRAGIGSVRLLPRQIASRDHAYAGVPVKFNGRGFIAAERRDIEPDAEASSRPAIAVTV